MNLLLDSCALLAIAHHRQLTILTSDQTIPTYRGVQTLW